MSHIYVARILLSIRHSFQDQCFLKYETTSFSGSIFTEKLKDILFRINLYRKMKRHPFQDQSFQTYPFQDLFFFSNRDFKL